MDFCFGWVQFGGWRVICTCASSWSRCDRDVLWLKICAKHRLFIVFAHFSILRLNCHMLVEYWLLIIGIYAFRVRWCLLLIIMLMDVAETFAISFSFAPLFVTILNGVKLCRLHQIINWSKQDCRVKMIQLITASNTANNIYLSHRPFQSHHAQWIKENRVKTQRREQCSIVHGMSINVQHIFIKYFQIRILQQYNIIRFSLSWFPMLILYHIVYSW